MAERAEPAVQRTRDEVPPETSVALAALVLAERRAARPPGEDWTARDPGGRLLSVWRIARLEAARRPGCANALAALTKIRHPNLVPVLAAGERDGGVWVVSEPDAGRPMRRLLAVATLTPEQAALVTVGVLAGLQALHQAGLWHGRLDETTVHVGEAGQVRLGEWGLSLDGQDPDERRDRDREAAVRLLGSLGRSVRRPGSRQVDRAAAMLRALDACRGEGGDEADLLARAGDAAAELLEGGAGERAAAELAALIGRLERESPSRAATTSLPAAAPLPRHPLQSAEAVWAPTPHRARWVAAGLAVLLVVTAMGALAVTARHGRLRAPAVVPHPSRVAGPRPTPGVSAPTPSATPAGPRLVPTVAPAAAGPITAIEIQPLQGSCQPGAACPVQVTVRLQPQPAAQEVRWSFRVFDRCTGTTSILPGASVTALAGWAYVYGTSWPTLSATHPLALVAVTESPAAAASPAVLAGETSPC